MRTPCGSSRDSWTSESGAQDADTLLFVEHPHVVTMGRNGKEQNLLASPEILARTGIEFFETDRGGDVTYHGPGQIVGYPIFDLREWKRDVHAYFQGVEQALIDALATVGVEAERLPQQGIRRSLGSTARRSRRSESTSAAGSRRMALR